MERVRLLPGKLQLELQVTIGLLSQAQAFPYNISEARELQISSKDHLLERRSMADSLRVQKSLFEVGTYAVLIIHPLQASIRSGTVRQLK